MKNEMVTFDGGINNLIAPHLIAENSTPYLADAYIHTGVLISAREPKLEDIPITDTNPTVGNNVLGSNTVYFKSKDQVISSGIEEQGQPFKDEDRFYVEWAGFLYWSNFVGDGSGKLARYDGTKIEDLGGHKINSTPPTLATDGTGLLNGSYSYTYTFVYSEVFESPPADIVEITPVANQKIKVTIPAFTPAGGDPTPTHVIIYRSGGLNPTFNKVERIPFGQTDYIDNTSDFKISRQELNTTANGHPPADIDMLTESNGTLFGAVGDKIHFSREGQPEYWDDYSFVQLPTKCTGLGVLGGTIIAFTEENMFAIIGTSILNVSIIKLPFQYGCIHKRSVQNLKGKLIWLTKLDEYDLLCSYNGSSVEIMNYTNLKVMSSEIGNFTYNYFTTETYADFSFSIKGSVTIGRRYLLFLNGRTVVLDLEDTPKTYYMEEAVIGAFELHNALYITKTVVDEFKTFKYLQSNSTRRNLSCITRDYTDGSLTVEKAYRKINVNAKGKWGMAVYVDGKNVFDFTHENGSTIFLPPGIHGKIISLSIRSEGYTAIKSIQYEYDILEDGFRTVVPAPIPVAHCELSVGGETGEEYHVAFRWNNNCILFKKGA